MAQKVKAIMIVEIAGRPADYLKEALVNHINQIRNLKYARLINATYSEPKKLEVQEEMYTCFAEVEVETNEFADMINLIFDFMPSSFELIEPSEMKINLSDATSILNTLSGRLHKYDEIAKISQAQVQQLAQKLDEMQKEKDALEVKKKPKKKK